MAQMLSSSYKPLALVTGLVSACVYLLILTAQVVALTKVLAPTFPAIPLVVMTIVPTSLVFLYTIKGGFVSVTVTDVLQLCFMIVFLFIPVAAHLLRSPVQHQGTTTDVVFSPMPVNLMILLSLALLFIPLSQDINLRVKSAASTNQALVGLATGAAFYCAIVFSATYSGREVARSGLPLADPERAFMSFFSSQSSLLAVAPIVAALVAIVSSLDAYALNTITAIAHDVIRNIPGGERVQERSRILLGAGLTFAFAMAVALIFNQVLALVLFALLMYISLLGPLVVGALVGVPGPTRFYAVLATLALLTAYRIAAVDLGPEAIVYPAIGILVMLGAHTASRFIGSIHR